MGAPLPEKAADGSWNRTELSSNDKLRKQLLGRNYDKVVKEAAANKASSLKAGSASSQIGKTAASAATPGKTESSDDEEEGRSAMVGKKKRMGNLAKTHPAAAGDETQTVDQVDAGIEPSPAKETSAKSAPSKNRKKTTSYLDELLAERSKKRRKR